MLNDTRLASPFSRSASACSSGVVPAFSASSPRCLPSIDGSARIAADDERLGAAAPGDVDAHFLDDLLALVAANAAEQRVAAVDLRPARDQCAADAGAAGVVGILIGVDLHAAGARRLDSLDERHREPVAGGAQRLHVADDADEPAFFGDRDHFLDRRDHADRVVGFIADVAAVDAAELRRHLRHGDHFRRLRVRAGRVVEAAREAESAGAHALPHEIDHLRELLRVGIAIGHAHHGLPDGSVRDHQSHVGTNALLAVSRPLTGEVGRPAAIRVDENRRDPLREDGLPLLERVAGEAGTSVRVDVDEPWSDDETSRVDRSDRRRRPQRPDRCDAVAENADVGADPRVARPVDDVRVADQQVEAFRRLRNDAGVRGGCGGKRDEQHGNRKTRSRATNHWRGGVFYRSMVYRRTAATVRRRPAVRRPA